MDIKANFKDLEQLAQKTMQAKSKIDAIPGQLSYSLSGALSELSGVWTGELEALQQELEHDIRKYSEGLGETVQHIQKTAQGLKEMDMVMNAILMPSNIVLHALSKVGFDVTSKRFISYQGRITPATSQLMARYKKGELYSYDTLFPKSKSVKAKAKNNYEAEILDAVKNHKVPSSDALRWGMGLAQDKHIKDPMKRQFIDTNLTNGQAASFAFDFIPFLGGAKAADEARTGKQYFTGKKLDVSDRAISAASVLGGGFVKWTGKGAKAVLKGKPLSEQTHLKWNKKTGEVKQHTPKKTKGTVNVGKIANEIAQTIKAVRAQQCKVIRSVENGEVALKTTKRKGNYGEMKMDDFFESQTYTRISDDRVLTLDQKIVKGIDGVYENLSPPPKYVIAEAKYNTSRLSNTKDGKQMSESWVDGSRRLESAVGEEMADRIREEMLLNPDNVQSILINVDKYGNVVKNILDSSGKKIIE
ncbi:hypothetical protein KXS12_07880 [Priestia filamentosa]|uniref:pre-toxin TG domain-containing protein n=1 Tax=Priestia filamentosa TaxID=1402861 RepID=UPI003F18E2B4